MVKEQVPEMSTVMQAVSRIQKAAVKIGAKKLDFENPAFLEVMFSSDLWTPFEEMKGFVTRVTDRSSSNDIIGLEAKWYESAFFPPHYHSQEEAITMLSGSAVFFLRKNNSDSIREVNLTKGDHLVIRPEEVHAGYIHAGAWLVCHFAPPIPQANGSE